MIRITKIETTYPAPESDDEDYCPDGDTYTYTVDDTVTFRELVDLMRDYSHASCSPASGSTREWLMTEWDQDCYTGDCTENSLHYSHDNAPRSARYWRLAMRAVGLI